jgi:hypothetical protein
MICNYLLKSPFGAGNIVIIIIIIFQDFAHASPPLPLATPCPPLKTVLHFFIFQTCARG